MSIGFADLFCTECGSYVHVFLDRCPACGVARRSRYDPGLEGDAIAPSNSSPEVLEAASVAMRRHLLTSRGRGFGTTKVELDPVLGLDVADLFSQIVDVIGYKAVGTAGQRGVDNVRLGAARGELRLEDPGTRRTVVSIPLSRVLSATVVARAGRDLPKWAGVTAGTYAGRGRPGGPLTDVLILHVDEAGVAELGIGNRGGLLAARARPDHYEEMVRWLGILAALEAGRRAQEIGIEAYRAELGLAPGVERRVREGDGRGAAAADVATARDRPLAGPDPEAAPSVAVALRDLEELRMGGLVTDAEYEGKRREILERL